MAKPAIKNPGHKLLRSSDYACQYMTHDSLVHRLGAGWKITIGILLSAFAVGARTPGELAALVVVALATSRPGLLRSTSGATPGSSCSRPCSSPASTAC